MKKYLYIALVLLAMPIFASAYTAELRVDSGVESINALEATLHVPNGVNIEGVSAGNSSVLFWIKEPTLDEQSETISFSGITPGGMSGDRLVLTISGQMSATDLDGFAYSDVRALKNDGAGTQASVRLRLVSATDQEDTAPPEEFVPIVGRDQEIYDGRYFLAFSTQDKGTGIDYYEVREGYFGSFVKAESPYLLTSQKLNKKIYVRAYDNAHNMREVSIGAPGGKSWYQEPIFLAILILLVAYGLLKSLWRKSQEQPST